MPAMLETLTGFLRDMDAPDEIMQAMAILTMPGVDAAARKSALTAHIAGVRGAVAATEEPQEPVVTDIDPPEEEQPPAKPAAARSKQSVEEKKRKAIERAQKSRERKKAQLETALV
jgi:outer membrane biosynthesis protein TonB